MVVRYGKHKYPIAVQLCLNIEYCTHSALVDLASLCDLRVYILCDYSDLGSDAVGTC